MRRVAVGVGVVDGTRVSGVVAPAAPPANLAGQCGQQRPAASTGPFAHVACRFAVAAAPSVFLSHRARMRRPAQAAIANAYRESSVADLRRDWRVTASP